MRSNGTFLTSPKIPEKVTICLRTMSHNSPLERSLLFAQVGIGDNGYSLTGDMGNSYGGGRDMPRKTEAHMEQRQQLVFLTKTGEFTLPELSQRFGVSRKTAHKWADSFEREGLEGLATAPRSPKNSPQKTATKLRLSSPPSAGCTRHGDRRSFSSFWFATMESRHRRLEAPSGRYSSGTGPPSLGVRTPG